MTDIWTAIGTVVVTLFGVWRMLVHYETRNDQSHSELGRRIDAMNSRIDEVAKQVNGRIDEVGAQVNRRIDVLYQVLVKGRDEQ